MGLGSIISVIDSSINSYEFLSLVKTYIAMSGADNPPVGRDHLEYLELQRAQAAAIAATADLNSSDIVAPIAAASPNFNSNDFSSTFSALPPRTAMNKLIMNYLVTGESLD